MEFDKVSKKNLIALEQLHCFCISNYSQAFWCILFYPFQLGFIYLTHQAQRSQVVISFDGGVRPYVCTYVQEQVRTCVQNKLCRWAWWVTKFARLAFHFCLLDQIWPIKLIFFPCWFIKDYFSHIMAKKSFHILKYVVSAQNRKPLESFKILILQ